MIVETLFVLIILVFIILKFIPYNILKKKLNRPSHNKISIDLIKNDKIRKINNEYYIKTDQGFWVRAGTPFISFNERDSCTLFIDGTDRIFCCLVKYYVNNTIQKADYFNNYCVYNDQFQMFFFKKKNLDFIDIERMKFNPELSRILNHEPSPDSKEQNIELFVVDS